MLQQFRGGTAEDQKPCGKRHAIRQHSQQRKQVGAALDLVNHHQSRERTQCRIRLGEAGRSLRVFQINVIERVDRNQPPSQRGLARLPRPQQRHDAAPFQGTIHDLEKFLVDIAKLRVLFQQGFVDLREPFENGGIGEQLLADVDERSHDIDAHRHGLRPAGC